MTVHHDKLAYGKLKNLNEELSEEELFNMLKELNEPEDKPEKENKDKKPPSQP